MNRTLASLLVAVVIIAFLFLPIFETTVAVGRNPIKYKITPLEKVGTFLARKRGFERLVEEITSKHQADDEKILAIYQWVKNHIRPLPHGWPPPPDDHEFNIIVRGYAQYDDQARIFCILTTFAGYPGIRYHSTLRYGPQPQREMVSAVYLNGRWLYLDLANDTYFRYKGRLASIEDIRSHPEDLVGNEAGRIVDRDEFLRSAKDLRLIKLEHPWFTRGHLQMLFPRIYYDISKILRLGHLYDYYTGFD